MMTM